MSSSSSDGLCGFPDELLGRIERCGVVAVLVIDRVEDAVPLARALLAGGVDVMELTLRTPAALEALNAIREEAPEMVAGIGTVLTSNQLDQVQAAGAAFGVAPGLNPTVVRHARQLGLPFAPGVVTPSEIERAIELGCRDLKFFPAEPSGGIGFLKSVQAPYAHLGLRYIPLGGLKSDHLAEYLSQPFVPALGGSWIAPRQRIQQQDWPAITAAAAEAAAKIREIKR